MAKHVPPLGLKFGAPRRGLNGGAGRDRDLFVPTLLLEDIEDDRLGAPRVGTAEDTHHVVQIARQTALGKGAELLAEDLGEAVTRRLSCGWKLVAVGVCDLAADWIVDQYFVGRQVNLYSRQVTPRAARPSVVDAALDGAPTSRRLVRLEADLVTRDFDARSLVDALSDGRENGAQGIRVDCGALEKSEVQILGEAIRLEVALLKAGATLEHPRVSDGRLGGDAPKEPAQSVVLLDDVLPE